MEKGSRKRYLRQSILGTSYMKFEDLEINSLKTPMSIYPFENLYESPVALVPHIKNMSREEEVESGDGVSLDLIFFGLQTFTQTLDPSFPV